MRGFDGRPMWQNEMERCRHFNGLINRECEVGIPYKQVCDCTGTPFLYPCINPAATVICERASYPTEAEAKEAQADSERAVAKVGEDIKNNICVSCGAPVMHYDQVGRCVYAAPCGHRQYQGTAPKQAHRA